MHFQIKRHPLLRQCAAWGHPAAFVLAALVVAGCGISQTALHEAVEAVQQEVDTFSNRWNEVRLESAALSNRVAELLVEMETRDEQIERLRDEVAYHEEQVSRATVYVEMQSRRFQRAIEAARGLQPSEAEEEPEAVLSRQPMVLQVEGTLPELVEVSDVVAVRSSFFPDKYGNIHLMSALRLSLRNRTDQALALHVQARRVGVQDPFGVLVLDLPPSRTPTTIRIPYDPGHDLIIRIDRQTTRYRLIPE